MSLSIVIIILSGALIFSAISVILKKSNFNSIIWFGLLGLFASLIMLLLGAPDVALTQFTVGVTLVVLVYVMAIRKQRNIVVGFVDKPFMFKESHGEMDGIEWEIIKRFEKLSGFSINLRRFETLKEGKKHLHNREVDILVGGITDRDSFEDNVIKLPYLETFIFKVENKEYDYAEYKEYMKNKMIQFTKPHEKTSYIITFSSKSKDLYELLKGELDDLNKSGELINIVERFF